MQHYDVDPTHSSPRAWTTAWMLIATIAVVLLFGDIAMTQFAGEGSPNGIALWGRGFANVHTGGGSAMADGFGILRDMRACLAYPPHSPATDLGLRDYFGLSATPSCAALLFGDLDWPLAPTALPKRAATPALGATPA